MRLYVYVFSRSHSVTELVESLCEPSAESSLLELSRGEAKDIKVPEVMLNRLIAESLNR